METERLTAEEPRCPKCGYTKEDALIHCDHHLCDGQIPEQNADKLMDEISNSVVEKLTPITLRHGYRMFNVAIDAGIQFAKENQVAAESLDENSWNAGWNTALFQLREYLETLKRPVAK